MSLAKFVLGLVLVYLGIRLTRWLERRRKFVETIDRLPGPPTVPFAPILNHAIITIYVDSLKHKLGTYTILYHSMLATHKVFPETGICRFWLGPKPVVLLYSAELVETILTSTSVLNKADEYRVFEPWIGQGLVTSKRSKWRFRRKILTPAFHFRILNDFLPIMNQEATKLIRKLNQKKYLQPGQVFDVTPLVALCTLDTICETAMGININCQHNEHSDYVKALHEVGETALSRVIRPWYWLDWVFYLTDSGRRFVEAKNKMQDFAMKVILERRDAWVEQITGDSDSSPGPSPGEASQEATTFDELRTSKFFTTNNKRLAFLDLLLHQHLVEKTMSIDDVREEVDTFMFAGHDTTAMNISWCLYMLGLHEDIQEKVRDELDKIIGPDTFDTFESDPEQILADRLMTTDITTEHIREMKYLDRVIKETLRMWPSIPFVARQMTEDVKVGDKYLIPEGATCVVLLHSLQNNPRYFSKPEVFDPDRFLPENTVGRHPFAYIPFSAGPRNCIGQKFAQMEVKVILAKLIRNYYIRTHDHRDKLAIVGELVLRSRNGLNVAMMPRFKGFPHSSNKLVDALYLLFFFISILNPFKLARVLCRCSASGERPRVFQQPNMIPIIWVLNLSAVRCWLTTDSCTNGFKAFAEDMLKFQYLTVLSDCLECYIYSILDWFEEN